jgi:phosphoglycolate phosphatase-like HAD superfamily hydrolase
VADSGRLLAITTNNAPVAVEVYLKDHGLDVFFEWRVYGRVAEDPAAMKPDPDCLLRAIDASGLRPGECLMVGDSPSDAAAAKSAGVPFLGYARSADRVARLRAVDPHPVVVGMPLLVAAAMTLPPPKG